MTQTNEPLMAKIAREAFRRAADRVIEKAEQTGTPVIIGKGGQIIRLTPEEAREHLKTSSDFPDDADDDHE